MFQVGDYIVKSGEGVCRIEDTVMMNSFDSEPHPYFLLVPVRDSRAKVYVPVSEEYKDMRPVMQEEDARQLLGRVPEIEPLRILSEKTRELTYKESVRSCDPEKLVSILKYMCIRSGERKALGKKITAVDDRYLKLAEDALYSELVFVLKTDPEEIRNAVRESVR